jgi:hypothetical protein
MTTKTKLMNAVNAVLDTKGITDEDVRQDLHLKVLEAAAAGSEFEGTTLEVAAKIEAMFFPPKSINLNWGMATPMDIVEVAREVLSSDQYNITMLYFSNVDPELIAGSFPGHNNIVDTVNDAIDRVRAALVTF